MKAVDHSTEGQATPATVQSHTGARRSLSERQAAVIFDTIAEQADTVQKLCIEAIMGVGADDDLDRTCRLLVAARELCGQVGFLADTGAKMTGGITLKNADPVEWFMPPVYPREEASHE